MTLRLSKQNRYVEVNEINKRMEDCQNKTDNVEVNEFIKM